MTLVSPSQSSAGEEINASDINGPINQLASVINGSLDDTNISSLSGTKITSATLPASAMNTAANVETRLAESSQDFVASGCLWSITSGLTGAMSSGVIYVSGRRVPVSAIASRVFTASKDTYVSVSNTGVVSYSEVANGASSPTLPADSLWLAMVITSGSAITTIRQTGVFQVDGYGRIGNLIDTNGVIIYPKPRNAVKQLLRTGYTLTASEVSTGLTLTVKPPTDRVVMIHVELCFLLNNKTAVAKLYDGTNIIGDPSNTTMEVSQGIVGGIDCFVSHSFPAFLSAGSHTLTVKAFSAGGGGDIRANRSSITVDGL